MCPQALSRLIPRVQPKAAPDECRHAHERFDTALSGYELLNDPLLNKGTAFTDAERDEFELHGLLPPYVTTLDLQVERRLDALREIDTDLRKYVFLRGLQDTNETLFYALLTRHIEELMPIVYTPTVGLGCQQFSRIFRKPRGLFLSYPIKDRIRQILGNPRFDGVEVIVVSDGERILGLGDQGAGGMGIPIGKLALYTACAGLHPSTTLPILLDVGTDNRELLDDPLYIGWRHDRVRGAAYDEFVATFVDAVRVRWPHVLLHWEDFAVRQRQPAAGAISRSAVQLQRRHSRHGRHRRRRHPQRDQCHRRAAWRTADRGAGSGLGGNRNQRAVAPGHDRSRPVRSGGARPVLSRRPLWPLRRGNAGIAAVSGAVRAEPRPRRGLEAFVGQPGRPGRSCRECAPDGTDRHIRTGARFLGAGGADDGGPRRPAGDLSSLSNPTERCEATPKDLIAWTDGRAVIGTGSPFPPTLHNGRQFRVDQTNNAYVYPGIGLGAIASRAVRISEGMFLAAARAIADLSPARRDPLANLLPPLGELRKISFHVAVAVTKQAIAEGLAPAMADQDLDAVINAKMWEPLYPIYRRVPAGQSR